MVGFSAFGLDLALGCIVVYLYELELELVLVDATEAKEEVVLGVVSRVVPGGSEGPEGLGGPEGPVPVLVPVPVPRGGCLGILVVLVMLGMLGI